LIFFRLDPDPLFGDDAEHYDLENASSIAPSDIDIVYHYKGYRRGGRSLPKKKKQQVRVFDTTTYNKHLDLQLCIRMCLYFTTLQNPLGRLISLGYYIYGSCYAGIFVLYIPPYKSG